jgi:penicillin-binding protein 1A
MSRWILLAALSTLTVVLSGLLAFTLWERSQRDELDTALDALVHYAPPLTVEVLDRHGEPFDRFGVQRREWVDLEHVSPWMLAAILAAEDRRFLSHDGVDPVGILRAARRNYVAGSIREGGSTLTQQLVKGVLVGDERSYERKIQEALLARRLEQRMSKDDILELYLNHTYFGSGNHGVQAAANDYFGLDAADLGPVEAALLAGIVPAPSAYSPRRDATAARTQRDRVLDDLVEVGVLERDHADELKQEAVVPRPRTTRGEQLPGDAYRTTVRRHVRDLFTEDGAYAHGLTLHTPYDPAVQRIAEQAVEDALDELYARQGAIEVGRIDDPDAFLAAAEGLERAVDGTPMVPTVGQCFPAMIRRPWAPVAVGPYRVALADGQWTRLVRSGDPEVPARPLAAHGWGTRVDLCATAAGPVVETTAWAEGAAVVIDNADGHVLAVVGGTDMALEGFNHATQAPRQPGSTFKPYVYGAALRAGWTQTDRVLDAPIRVGRWAPRNAGGYHGRIPMRTALTYSLNTAAVRLALDTGLPEVRAFARDVGVTSPLRHDLTLALGSSEVTVMDQATGYATIARGGRTTEPVFLTEVRDVTDRVVARPGTLTTVGGRPARLPASSDDPAIPAAVAIQLRDMLQEVVRSGTGRRAYDPLRERAGKTGTTSDQVDAWFAGFTPDHTVVVWVGTHDRRSLGPGEYGSRAALPAWRTIVDALDGRSSFSIPAAARPIRFGGDIAWVPRETDRDTHQALPSFPRMTP